MRAIFLFTLFLSFAATCAVSGQTRELSIDDRRQIIESLLIEASSVSETNVIRVSAANLPAEILESFPAIKNKRVEIISPEISRETCAYEFGEFEILDSFVSVAFGDCNSGLAYDFKKYGDTWKSVGLNIPK
jgi:hypothetical protein